MRPSRPQPTGQQLAAAHFHRSSSEAEEEDRPSSWGAGAAIDRGSLPGAVVEAGLESSQSRREAEAGRERPCAGVAA